MGDFPKKDIFYIRISIAHHLKSIKFALMQSNLMLPKLELVNNPN